MSSKHQINALLKDANLLKYEEKFVAYGADDAKQIALSSQEEFEQLISYVGMCSKPLHVTRLLTSLNKLYGLAPRYIAPPLPNKSDIMYQGQPEFIASGSGMLFEHLPKRRKPTPYYGEIKLPHEEIFAELTDERSETETQELIAELSAIYRHEPLTKYQQYINACAAELAIRDPTLLARRSDLAAKARDANVRGGHYKFHKGFSVSKLAPNDLHHSRRSKLNFASAMKHREDRLTETRKLENSIETFTFEKEGLFSKLKHETDRDNKVAIGVVRSRLDYVEEQIYIAKKRVKKLRLAQRRSEKYFTSKLNAPEDEIEIETENIIIERPTDEHHEPHDSTPRDVTMTTRDVSVTTRDVSMSTHDPIKIMNCNKRLETNQVKEPMQLSERQMLPQTLPFPSIEHALEEIVTHTSANTSPLPRDVTIASRDVTMTTRDVTMTTLSRDYQITNGRTVPDLPDYGISDSASTSHVYQPDVSGNHGYRGDGSHGYQTEPPCVMEELTKPDILTDVFSSTIGSTLQHDQSFNIASFSDVRSCDRF